MKNMKIKKRNSTMLSMTLKKAFDRVLDRNHYKGSEKGRWSMKVVMGMV